MLTASQSPSRSSWPCSMYVTTFVICALYLMRTIEQEDELRDAILLVFANKQDSRGALNAQQVCESVL